MKRKPGDAPLRVKVVRLAHAKSLALPSYQSDGAAGMDLLAAVPSAVPLRLSPGKRALVPTGLVLELPPGFEAQVRPRSGLAAKHGVTVLNSPGTIDADYRGEVKVLLVNHDLVETIELRRGDRVAQLVFQQVEQAAFTEVEVLPESVRGVGGYGSTGGFGTPEPSTGAGSERT
jgi:dUTP pyrophosphatase